jgi:DNA-binding LytR/AlgR family response regulator
MFFRIHRSTLINLTAKFQIEPWEDGRLRLHFNGGVTLIAARDPAQRLRAKLGF